MSQDQVVGTKEQVAHVGPVLFPFRVFAGPSFVQVGLESHSRCVCVALQVYDIQTGRRTLTLFQESLAGHYRRNRATFSPSDQLLLNDGVLWDVRSSRAVHRFDQFNASISGQFHPNGLEVIANTEVVSFIGISGTRTYPALTCSGV